jgi:two-component system OmpR family response regulator
VRLGSRLLATLMRAAIMNILVVEDDRQTGELIVGELTREGHRVTLARTGSEAFHVGVSGGFDVAILDRMLPDIDGIETLQHLRRQNRDLPILMLTALDSITDRVRGLDAGADDYLAKPFAFQELVARLAALHRRPMLGSQSLQFAVGDISIDLLRRRVTRANRDVNLKPREFELLALLAENVGRAVTRKMFLEQIWRIHYDPNTNIVESHISRLRTKLREGFETDPIETIQGTGYRLRASA